MGLKGEDFLTRAPLSALRFSDLEFARMPVRCYSSRGTPFTRWEPLGVPRIPPRVLDCVCYLYDSEEDARAGLNFGGTGFLVGAPSATVPNAHYLYVVTNWHVACRGTSVVRINTTDGGTDIFPYGPE